jgi:hypothetical protein
MVLPESGHISAEYMAGAEGFGVIWYFVYVRSRLNAGSIGPHAIRPDYSAPPIASPAE